MPLSSFDDIYAAADARPEPVVVAVAGGDDRTVLGALREATDRGWVRPILAGRAEAIRALAASTGVEIDDVEILDTDNSARDAAAACRSGRAALLMKGQIATPALMEAVLDPENGLRTGRAIFQAVLMEIGRDGRRFLLADTGIMIRPDLAKKADMLRALVALAAGLGATEPRVALMAATERVVDSMPETLHAAELQRRGEAGEFAPGVVQGPLSFDLAYAADAADKKRIGGPVVGAADAMIFPDLAAANLTVKAIMYTADCRFGGLLLGAACPVVFMSRADTMATRLNSLALALAAGSGP
jgi:phosphotransacetylase